MTKDKYGFVYITTNLVNGKKYIGRRKYYNGWENYLGSGVIIKKAIDLYGEDNFKREIICECNTKEELYRMEEYYINLYKAYESDDFYNISASSNGGYDVIAGRSMEYRIKIANKISRTRIEQGCAKGENNGMFGKNHTEETKKKMSNNHRFNNGEKMSEETKQKISYATTGSKNPNSKEVICLNNMEVFSFMGEACKKYNILDKSGMVKCCKYKRKSCGKLEDGTKLTWMYLCEYNEMIDMNMCYKDYVSYKRGSDI